MKRGQWLSLGFLMLLVLLLRVVLFHEHVEQRLQLSAVTVLQVEAGTSFTRIVRQLQANGVLVASDDLLRYARFKGLANRIKAGEYELEPGLRARGLLELLVSGRVRLHQVTLVEGWTLQQALRALQSHPAVAITLDASDQTALQAAFGLTVYPEGWFFPDTYRFTRGTSDLALLQQAHAMMRQVLDVAWAARAAELPLDGPEQALVLASIIEKETGLASEREEIAGVFIRRLQNNMRLQTDPTVIYGLGDSFAGNLTRAHLQADTPWNTYTRSGLPPTPIALPGRAAIEAALHPAAGSSLYFVAKGDGSHYFSSTLAEHERAVRLYQLGISTP